MYNIISCSCQKHNFAEKNVHLLSSEIEAINHHKSIFCNHTSCIMVILFCFDRAANSVFPTVAPGRCRAPRWLPRQAINSRKGSGSFAGDTCHFWMPIKKNETRPTAPLVSTTTPWPSVVKRRFVSRWAGERKSGKNRQDIYIHMYVSVYLWKGPLCLISGCWLPVLSFHTTAPVVYFLLLSVLNRLTHLQEIYRSQELAARLIENC